MPLTQAEIGAILEDAAQGGVIALGQLHQILMDAGPAGRGLDGGVPGVQARLAEVDVLPGAQGITAEVLVDDADLGPKVGGGEVPRIGAVQEDLAPVRVIKPGKQLGQGGLAGAVAPDQGHDLAGTDAQIDPAQDLALGARIAEMHLPYRDTLPPGTGDGQSHRWLFHLALHLEKFVQGGEKQVVLIELGQGAHGGSERAQHDMEGAEVHHQFADADPLAQGGLGDEGQGGKAGQGCHTLTDELTAVAMGR